MTDIENIAATRRWNLRLYAAMAIFLLAVIAAHVATIAMTAHNAARLESGE